MGWSVVFLSKSVFNIFSKIQIIYLLIGGLFFSLGAIIYVLGGRPLPRCRFRTWGRIKRRHGPFRGLESFDPESPPAAGGYSAFAHTPAV